LTESEVGSNTPPRLFIQQGSYAVLGASHESVSTMSQVHARTIAGSKSFTPRIRPHDLCDQPRMFEKPCGFPGEIGGNVREAAPSSQALPSRAAGARVAMHSADAIKTYESEFTVSLSPSPRDQRLSCATAGAIGEPIVLADHLAAQVLLLCASRITSNWRAGRISPLPVGYHRGAQPTRQLSIS